MAITGYFILVDVPEVPVGEDIEATIDFYAINPGAWYWKTFLIAVSYQLDLERELDAAREIGQEGGRKKTYTLGKMPDKKVIISFFIFAHDNAAYDWNWEEFLVWLDGFPVEVTHLDSEYVTLSPIVPPPPPGWVQVAAKSIVIKKTTALIGWVEVATKTIAIEKIAAVIGWVQVAEKTIGIPVSGVAPPCTPGEHKCIGPDLYECSLDGEWVLVEENSPQCAVEEKEFPWLLVAGGLGVAAVAVAATTKKKKPIK